MAASVLSFTSRPHGRLPRSPGILASPRAVRYARFQATSAVAPCVQDFETVSIDVSQPLKAIEHPLQDAIRELRQGYQTVSECLQQTIAECDLRGNELADCRRQLAEARRSLSEYERQVGERARAESDLLNRCATLKRHLDAKQTELAQTNERLAQTQADTAGFKQKLETQQEHNRQLRAQFEHLTGERDAARNELAQLQSQVTPLTDNISETATLKGELEAARFQIKRLQDQIAVGPTDSEAHEQQLAAQFRREQLETEVETLRQQAAEMSETLAQQLRLGSQERQQWFEELRLLRHLIERGAAPPNV